MSLIGEHTVTTCCWTKAKCLAATADTRALTNALAESHDHNNATVTVASMAGTMSIFANKAGTSPVEATCCTTGLVSSAATLALTTLTTATAGGPGHDNVANNTPPSIDTTDILAIEAGTPTYNVASTATAMSKASNREGVYNVGNNNDNTGTDDAAAGGISRDERTLLSPTAKPSTTAQQLPPKVIAALAVDPTEPLWAATFLAEFYDRFTRIDKIIAATDGSLDTTRPNNVAAVHSYTETSDGDYNNGAGADDGATGASPGLPGDNDDNASSNTNKNHNEDNKNHNNSNYTNNSTNNHYH